MERILTCIKTQDADCYHTVGQKLLRPLSVTFGHTYQVQEGKIEELPNSTLKKVLYIALALLLLPMGLLLSGVGALLLSCSSTHKNAYSIIAEQEKDLIRESANRVLNSNYS